jgi:hypothetical protein
MNTCIDIRCRRPGTWLLSRVAFLGMIAVLAGCTALEDRADYHRHTMSDLREDWRRPGVFLFETSTSSLYPADSAEAEAKRMEWLAGWMKRLGYCPSGWEVFGRAPVPPAEQRGARHDLRYDVRCLAAPAGPTN